MYFYLPTWLLLTLGIHCTGIICSWLLLSILSKNYKLNLDELILHNFWFIMIPINLLGILTSLPDYLRGESND